MERANKPSALHTLTTPSPEAELAQLEAAQLIRRTADADLAYVFKHTLTQENVYGSLLFKRRREIHRHVAEALEQVYPERVEELSAVLAYHWEQAEIPARALPYLWSAGQNAAQRHAYPEALSLFTHALALTPESDWERELEIRQARAELHEFLSEYRQALADYEAARQLAERHARERDECHILARMVWLKWLSGQDREALALAFQVQSRAQSLDERSDALRAYLVIGLVAQAEGHLPEAYTQMRHALTASRAAAEHRLEGESLFYLGVQNNFMGRFGRAAAYGQKAYQVKKELGDPVGQIVSLYLQARAECGRGNYDAALEALESGRLIAEEIQNPFGLAQYPNTRAWLCAELGDWETAYELDYVGLQIAHLAPVRPPEISTLLNLVLDCIALGKLDQADSYLLDVDRWIGLGEYGFHAWRWQIRRTDACARLLIAHGLYEEARPLVTGLLDWAGRTHAGKYRARGLVLHGQIHMADLDLPRAELDLTAARDQADLICYVPIQVQSRRLLAQVYESSSVYEKAADARHEAAACIDGVDRRLKHPDLRRSFERGLKRQAE